MAGANSLANLVVRLVGDGSSFTRMLDKAESDTASATATIGTETKKATSTADRALDKYGNEVKQASKENKTLAHEVEVVQTALQGQRVRVNAAGRAIDDYGKFVKKAGMDLKALGQGMQSVGVRMSVGVTLPILAAAGASVKLASDMEETDSKLKATFSSMGDEAETAAQRLRKSFNMGGLEAKRLLANTGDMLTGFGFSQEAALGLSLQVQELSADLASFQNLPGGAAQASDALTKALLGEREAAKALGIAILEEDVKRQVQLQRAQGIIHATERQAKAYATMQLALKQSKNAIGDVARTQGSFANQMRTLGNTVSEVALVIGQDLLPIATAMVEWAQSAIGIFLEIPAPIRVVGYALAALAAAIGPVLVVGGTLLTMMATYNAALAMTGLTTKALIVQTWLSVKAFTAQALAAGRAKITMLASAVAARASAAGTAVATAASSVMALGLKGAVVALGGLVAGFLASAKAAVLAAAAWVAANAALLGIPLLIAGVAVAAYAAGVALRRAFGLTGIEDFNREL
jgi:hypothetical protein